MWEARTPVTAPTEPMEQISILMRAQIILPPSMRTTIATDSFVSCKILVSTSVAISALPRLFRVR